MVWKLRVMASELLIRELLYWVSWRMWSVVDVLEFEIELVESRMISKY